MKQKIQRNASPQQQKAAYEKTMQAIRPQLNFAERLFSNIIHNPIIETLSDLLGKTIMRPYALLFGGLFAFVGVLTYYMYARYVGLGFTGSEVIVAFIVGWVFGSIIELVTALFRRS